MCNNLNIIHKSFLLSFINRRKDTICENIGLRFDSNALDIFDSIVDKICQYSKYGLIVANFSIAIHSLPSNL